MRGLHCFFYPFTDLGWHALEGNGSSAGPRQEGFIWHSAPGCVHLPADTRVCFHRCDNATCMLQQARALLCACLGMTRIMSSQYVIPFCLRNLVQAAVLRPALCGLV